MGFWYTVLEGWQNQAKILPVETKTFKDFYI